MYMEHPSQIFWILAGLNVFVLILVYFFNLTPLTSEPETIRNSFVASIMMLANDGDYDLNCKVDVDGLLTKFAGDKGGDINQSMASD